MQKSDLKKECNLARSFSRAREWSESLSFLFFISSINLQFDLSGLVQCPLNLSLGRPKRPINCLKIGVILSALLDPEVYLIDVLHCDQLFQRLQQLAAQRKLRSCFVYVLSFGFYRLADYPFDLLMQTPLLLLQDCINFVEDGVQVLVDNLLKLREHFDLGLNILFTVKNLQLAALYLGCRLHYLLVDQDPGLLHVHDVVVTVFTLNEALGADAPRVAVIAKVHCQLVSMLAAVPTRYWETLDLAYPEGLIFVGDQPQDSISLQS